MEHNLGLQLCDLLSRHREGISVVLSLGFQRLDSRHESVVLFPKAALRTCKALQLLPLRRGHCRIICTAHQHKEAVASRSARAKPCSFFRSVVATAA